MKKLLSFLLTAFLLLSAPALAREPVTVYTSDGFTITYPASWSRDAQSSDLLSVDMPDDFSFFNLMRSEIPLTLTAATVEELLFPSLLQDAADSFDNVVKVDVPSPAVYGDNEFAVLAYTLEYGGDTYYCEHYYLCQGETLYAFTGFYPSPDSEYIQAMSPVLASFRVLDGAEPKEAYESAPVSVETPPEAEGDVYTDPSGFSAVIPEGWHFASEDTLALLSGGKSGLTGGEVSSLRARIIDAVVGGRFALYAPDFRATLSVTSQPGGSLDAAALTVRLDELFAGYQGQLSGAVTRLAGENPAAFGANRYARLSLSYGQPDKTRYLEAYLICSAEAIWTIEIRFDAQDTPWRDDLDRFLTTFRPGGTPAEVQAYPEPGPAATSEPTPDPTPAQEASLNSFTHPDGYSFSYPSNWTFIDEEALGVLLELVGSMEWEDSDMDEALAQVQDMDTAGYLMLYSPDFSANLVVHAMDVGLSADGELLSALIPSLLPQMKASLGDGAVMLNEDDTIVTFGENTYAYVVLSQGGGNPHRQECYLYCPHGTLYQFTYTYDGTQAPDREGLETILATFSVGD